MQNYSAKTECVYILQEQDFYGMFSCQQACYYLWLVGSNFAELLTLWAII
jgi:hypothetical protein